MKALITGGGGFVGKYLAEHLRSSGDEVEIIDRHGGHPCDITDANATREIFEQLRPNVVYHLAAISHVGQSWDEPNQVLRVNVEGTANVLRASQDGGVERVLVIGSAEEYGNIAPDEVPVSENNPLRPITPYGASKVAAGFLALQTFLATKFDVVRVRAFTHTGPGQSDRFVVPALAKRIVEAERSGATSIPVGNLEPVRDISDVRDVVRAYRMLTENGQSGEVYNVCSGTGVSIEEIAQTLIKKSGRYLKLEIDPELVRPVDVPVLIGDNTKLKTHTTWKPEYSLEQTLNDVLSYWKQ